MKNKWMHVCCLLLMICMAAAWIPASAEEGYTIDNIRQYVAGLDEPVELADGTTRPPINFDNLFFYQASQRIKQCLRLNGLGQVSV